MELTKLIFFKEKETLTATKYLRKVLIPIFNDINSRKRYRLNIQETKLFVDLQKWTFQQDGASSHTANNVQKWLLTNSKHFISKTEWAGNFPDLNPIENLWAWMGTKIYENGHVESIEKLKEKFNKYGIVYH